MRGRRPTRGAIHDEAMRAGILPARVTLGVARAWVGRLALVLVAIISTGCAASTHAWRAGPAGIPAEREIRSHLVSREYASAWAAVNDKKIAPSDALLRHMYKGLVALHAGELETGARAMDRAWEIADQRWTKRVSDAAMSMVTSDAALPYTPGPAEHAFIPAYGALAWLARNEVDDAAVEARRLSTVLAAERGPRPPDDFRAGMRYLAGVLYEATGERADAEVAYRNAGAILGPGGLALDTLPPDAAHGDVVVLIEDGFVVRPEPQSLTFWFDDDELAALSSDRYETRFETVSRIRARRRIAGQPWNDSFRMVTLSWPTMPLEFHPRATTRVGARAIVGPRGEGDEATTYSVGFVEYPSVLEAPTLSLDVSRAVREDFEREQPMRLVRAIARAAVRDAAFDGAGKAFENAAKDDDDDDDDKKGKGMKKAGSILLGIGLLAAGASSAILDQADLRAWQLLPDRVTIARLRLPVGEHPIEVTRDGEAVSLGTVSVRPGAVSVLHHRWWPGSRPVVAASGLR